MLGESLRKWGFWVLDGLHGGQINKHYKDIKKIIEGGNKYKERTNKLLCNLLEHTVNESKYYSDYKGFNNIKDFPVINKNIIKENYEKILSKDYIKKNLHYMSTSGSTGTPFTIGQDENKRKRVLAEIIYFGELCGYCLGDRNAYLRVWTESNKKSKFGAWKQNLVMIDISKLDRINLENIRTILKRDKNLKCILGYATSLDIISKYLLEMNDSPDMFGIEVVISGAEVLNEVTRNNLKKVFNCNVVSRYSNQENGILAQELIDSNFFIINNASYYIEFLKLDSDNYAEIGEQSRMVVTDLFNYAMPMIRYDTGDLAVVEENEKYDKVIKSIEGRKVDFIYSTEGKRLSPHVITNNMWNFNKIKQYQLIQEDKSTYVLKLNCSGEIYKDDEIIGTLKRTIGEDANISIKHVEGIPFLKSGKFRTVICNYKPNETETK